MSNFAAAPRYSCSRGRNLLRAWGGTGAGRRPETDPGFHDDTTSCDGGSGNKDSQFEIRLDASGAAMSRAASPKGRQANTRTSEVAASQCRVPGQGNSSPRLRIPPPLVRSETGADKRLGALAAAASDDRTPAYDPGQPPATIRRARHCVRFSKKGALYVCDRINDRVQTSKRRTFVAEAFREKPRLKWSGRSRVFIPPRSECFTVADGVTTSAHYRPRDATETLARVGPRPGPARGSTSCTNRSGPAGHGYTLN